MPNVFPMLFAEFPQANCGWRKGRVNLWIIAIELERDGLSYMDPVVVKKILHRTPSCQCSGLGSC